MLVFLGSADKLDEKLLGYDFEWVLPGHGRIYHDPRAEMKKHLEDCVRRMQINIGD